VEDVDDRIEVRDFLATRRAKLTPDQAGVPFYGRRRRVPGLRREEVAQLAGVSTDYYPRLEKGDLAGASDTVLDASRGICSWTRPSGITCSTSPAPPSLIALRAAPRHASGRARGHHADGCCPQARLGAAARAHSRNDVVDHGIRGTAHTPPTGLRRFGGDPS
jgi:hypothetical protein